MLGDMDECSSRKHGAAAGSTASESCSSSVFKEKSFLFVTSVVLCLKCLLIPAYHSTDFEVHRNWMAITHKLPLEKWYYENTSEWTLDYPPFFAYFEHALSLVCSFLVPSALVIQKEPFFTDELLYFHRFTVIFMDLLYILCCGFCADSLRCVIPRGSVSPHRNSISLCLALVANVSLLMLDNIHFQYNSFLTSFLLLSLGLVLRGRFLWAAFFYCVLLNYKHIYLYYAPAYVVFYAVDYLWSKSWTSVFLQATKLAVVILVPFALSFGVFIYRTGLTVVTQILSRLFPFQRGLTHAYWAPNLWAFYNSADLVLYHALRFFKKLPHDAKPPAYTTGLVQEYSHSVLPSVSASATLLVVFLLLTPMAVFLFKRSASRISFMVLLVHSAFAFFLAGYHVHEKAIIMVTIPYTVLAFADHRYLESLLGLSVIANVSLFPLFFTPFEDLIKVILALLYYFFLGLLVDYACTKSGSKLSALKRVYLSGLVATQLYAMILHRVIFGSRYEFVPLMVTSISTSLGVIMTFVEFIWISYQKSSNQHFDREKNQKAKSS